MVNLINAILAGILSIIVRKLGPTIILFFYIWVYHSKFYARLGGYFLGLPVNGVLAATAILLGVASLAFKDQVATLSRRMDTKAMPFLHEWTLRRINDGDFLVMTVQRCSQEAMTGLKSAAVFLILVLVAAATFPVFALVLLSVVVAVLTLSWHAARHPTAQGGASFFTKLRTHPEYYAELLVSAGLIIAFLAMATEKSLISGTMFILIVARFSNEIKVVAKSMVVLLRTRIQVETTWQNRAAQAERRLKWQAEAEARKRAIQAEAAARRQQNTTLKAAPGLAEATPAPEQSRLPAA